jgi:hypothetical protein
MERMFIDDAIKLLSIIKDPYEPTSDYTSCYVTPDTPQVPAIHLATESAEPSKYPARPKLSLSSSSITLCLALSHS